ncbi:MAG: trigger factor [Christensenellaceae bacterium]|jgi:trigger factor
MASVKELGNNKVKVEFEISQDALKEATEKAFQKSRGKYAVPGFRKGKAPRAVIERYYGEGLFFEEAFDLAFPDSYRAAIDELDLFVVSQPEMLEIISMEQNEPIRLSIEVYVKPEVELGKYKGEEVVFAPEKLAKDAVAMEIDSVLERNARYVDVERAAKDGDRVILDYSGSVDGIKFDGGTAEGQTLDLGSGMFIPGFEEQVVGMNVGDEKKITVTFPEEYHEPSLAGKEAIFEVKLGAIKEKELPEANDEFAQDVSEFDTFEEYKADLQKKLEEQNETQNKNRLESAVVETIVADSKVEIPEAMVESQIDNQLQEMTYSLMYQGMSMEQYLQYTGMSMEDMRAQLKEPSETRVKTQLVLEAIKEKEGIKASEEELDKTLEEYATMQNKTLEEYKKEVKPEEMEYLQNRSDFEALGNYLVAQAKVVAPKEEAPKKKAPAKKKAAPKKDAEEKKETAPKKKTAAAKKKEEAGEASEKKPAKKATKKRDEVVEETASKEKKED